MTVNEEVSRAIQDFRSARKPMGFCCIAPILAAKLLPHSTLTLGCRKPEAHWPFGGALGVAEALGSNVNECDVDKVCVDKATKVVSTPAYMKGSAAPHEVFEGIGRLVSEVLQMSTSTTPV